LLIDLFVGFLFPIAILIFLYQFRLFEIPMNWWGWILVFVLYDFTWYIDHYIAHRTGLFWALHSVHHSSKEYNTTVASRGSLLETFGARPLFYLLPIFGVSPIQFILIKLVTNVWGIAQHTRLVGKLGILDLIFATPSNHRVHHGSDVHYLDKNYGEVLILWDRLCGTFARETHEPNYGLTKNIETYNPLMIQVAGIRWLSAQIKTANKWQDKLAYLYQPPGWRHDGKGETTRDLRNISK
jgi:sterol desaturase/sphingolipid hydroxylase (fatty acid hydroxylase superfamily)